MQILVILLVLILVLEQIRRWNESKEQPKNGTINNAELFGL
jgi:hypothetical protein